MERVGKHLAEVATSKSSVDEIDLFARSAFNRFYYAAFLATRETLRKLDDRWREPNHKDVPAILRGRVVDRVTEELKRQSDAGIPLLPGLPQLTHEIHAATDALAQLLKQAYSVRRTADYKPEARALRSAGMIMLDQVKLSQAEHWPRRARAYALQIERVYGKLALL